MIRTERTIQRLVVGAVATAGAVVALSWAQPPRADAAPPPPPEDFADYDALLREYVDEQGLVDYAGWKRSDEQTLRRVVRRMATLDPDAMSRFERKAYWINVYNAVTLQAILESYPLASIKDLVTDDSNVWDDYGFGPDDVSLNHIEHQLLRPMGDPRIHSGIVCASKGCPPLRPEAYVSDRLNEQLEDNCRVWINDDARGVRIDGRTAYVSEIFNWFGDDFAPDRAGHLAWIVRYADEDRARVLSRADTQIEPLEWDWALNEQ
jgi:Protein of unknown function, DUF547